MTDPIREDLSGKPGSHGNPPDGEMAPFGYREILARDKAGYVLRHFNSIAGLYDFMNTLLSFGIHYIWKRRAVAALGLKGGETVLDVCGGTGDLSILAARAAGRQGRVVLYDINRAMIMGARPKIARASLGDRICSIQGDAETMSFPGDLFDAAMIGFGIRNLTHMEKGLAEMHRVLRPGGTMVCLEFSLPVNVWFRALYDFYSFCIMPVAGRLLAGTREAYLYLPETIRKFPPPEDFASMMHDAGFSNVSFERLTNGIAVVYRGVKL